MLRTTDITQWHKDPATGVLLAEASDLGWPPGEWPPILGVTIGEGATAVLLRTQILRDGEGDVTCVRYTGDGLMAEVLND